METLIECAIETGALASQEPVGLVYAGQDGYGASLKQGLEHGTKLYTSPQPDLTEKVKELEDKLEVAICSLQKIWNGTGSNFNAQMCAVEAIKQIGQTE
jgi:hypothetical protein